MIQDNINPEGTLFSQGCGSDNVLGHGSEINIDTPKHVLIPTTEPISQISLGLNHGLCCTRDGHLYSQGSNQYGQLGRNINSIQNKLSTPSKYNSVDNEQNEFDTPRFIQSLETKKIVGLSCGLSHSLVVSHSRSAYGFGSGEFGQLGINSAPPNSSKKTDEETELYEANLDLEFKPVPRLLKQLEDWSINVAQVACGETHSLLLSTHGRIYSFGDGMLGALGISALFGKNISYPHLIDNLALTPIISISAGNGNSFACSSTGCLYSQGRGRHGATAQGSISNLPEPQRVYKNIYDRHIVDVNVGSNFGACLDDVGRLYTFGNNRFGQLGLGNKEDYFIPLEVTQFTKNCIRVRKFACGSDHMICSNHNGSKLFSQGHNNNGQLGFKNLNEDKCSISPTEISFSDSINFEKKFDLKKDEDIEMLTNEEDKNLSFNSQETQPKFEVLDIACGSFTSAVVLKIFTELNTLNNSFFTEEKNVLNKNLNDQFNIFDQDEFRKRFDAYLNEASKYKQAPVPNIHALSNLVLYIKQIFSSPTALNASFIPHCSKRYSGFFAGLENNLNSSELTEDRIRHDLVLYTNNTSLSTPTASPTTQSGSQPAPKIPAIGSSNVRVLNSTLFIDLTNEESRNNLKETDSQIPSISSNDLRDYYKKHLVSQIGQTVSTEPIKTSELLNDPLTEQQYRRHGGTVGIDCASLDHYYSLILSVNNSKINQVILSAQEACLNEVQKWVSKSMSTKNVRSGNFRCLAIILQNPLFLMNTANSDQVLFQICDILARLPSIFQLEYKSQQRHYDPEIFLNRLVKPLVNAISREISRFNKNSEYQILSRNVQAFVYILGRLNQVNLSPLPIDLLNKPQSVNTPQTSNSSNTNFNDSAITSDAKSESSNLAKSSENILPKQNSKQITKTSLTIISQEEFHVHNIIEHINLKQDYLNQRNFLANPPSKAQLPPFSFCSHSFMLSPLTKARILQHESKFEEHNAVLSALMPSDFRDQKYPFMILEVRRDHLLQDVMDTLPRYTESELKRPFRVRFQGELGVDFGGILSEFLTLTVAEFMKPELGLFVYNSEMRTLWYNSHSVRQPQLEMFYLCGEIIGLACFNAKSVGANFPLVLYRKLLGLTPTLEDLKIADPQMGQSLEQLLEYEDEVEDVFYLTFEVSAVTDEYNSDTNQIENKGYELIPNGANIAVTNENRQLFVEKYVEYLLHSSVKKQADSFADGFRLICAGYALTLFTPSDLELLICGSQNLDFNALKDSATYQGGYTESSNIIRQFQEIVIDEFNEEQKKEFLVFCTGSARSPMGGLGTLKIVILRGGPDSEMLPTSSTCFYTLIIPDYSSKNKLLSKLLISLKHGQGGFGLQ